MGGWRRRPRLHPWLLTFLLALSSFPTVDTDTDTDVLGAGASFPNEVYQSWILTFTSQRQTLTEARIRYESTGSSAGKRRITGEEEPASDYAGSDSLMDEDQKTGFPDLKMFPTMAGAVVIGYNLPEFQEAEETLVLSVPVLTGIYNGTITRWNHSAILDLNPSVPLPGEDIIVIARADKSGTTNIYTSGLAQDDRWRDNYGDFSKPEDWPAGVIRHLGRKNIGMAGLVLSFKYSVGYMSVADAKSGEVEYAKILNSFGSVVEANTQSVQDAMDQASKYFQTSDDLTATLAEFPGQKSYPIAGFTYLIVQMTGMTDCTKAVELVRYIDWFMVSEDAIDLCADLNMTPLSSSLVDIVREKVLKQMTCDGQNVWAMVESQKEAEGREDNMTLIAVACVMSLVCAFVLGGVGVLYLVRHIKFIRQLNKNEWLIDVEDILFYHTAQTDEEENRFVLWPSFTSLTDVADIEDGCVMVEHVLHWPGKWQGITIGLRLTELKLDKDLEKDVKAQMLSFMQLDHSNVLKFYGFCNLDDTFYAVNEFSARGSLLEVIEERKFDPRPDFKYSIALDLIQGLCSLHSKNIIHGHLRSLNCIIDSKWTLKIADWEFNSLYRTANKSKSPLLFTHKSAADFTDPDALLEEYWTAPEILKAEYLDMPTVASDIYSISIIIHEIFTLEKPYCEHYETMDTAEILKAITTNNLRPRENDLTPNSLRSIMEAGWNSDVTKRPTTLQYAKSVRKCHNCKKSAVEIILESSRDYTHRLETDVKVVKKRLVATKKSLNDVIKKRVPAAFVQHVTEKLSMAPNSNCSRQSRDRKSYSVTRNAAIVSIKCSYSYDDNEDNMWSIYNNLDLLIENLVQTYGGHRVDISSGMFVVVMTEPEPDWSLPGPSTRHHRRRPSSSSHPTSDGISLSNFSRLSGTTSVFTANTSVVSPSIVAEDVGSDCTLPYVQAAAELALNVTQCGRDLFMTSDGRETGGFLVAVHTGPVHMCLLDNSDSPKCVYLGKAMDLTCQLVESSNTRQVLVSGQFAHSLEDIEDSSYDFDPMQAINGVRTEQQFSDTTV